MAQDGSWLTVGGIVAEAKTSDDASWTPPGDWTPDDEDKAEW